MRFTLRLVVAIWLSSAVVVGGFTWLQVVEERQRFTRELERRAVLLGDGLQEAVEPALARGSQATIARLVAKFGGRQQGLAVYDHVATLVGATPEVAVVLDASGLARAERAIWRSNAIRFFALGVVLSLMALVIVRLSITRPMAEMARWTKAVRSGHPIGPLDLPDPDLFGPMTHEVSVLAWSLHRARAAAEREATLRLVGEARWTEERLTQFAKLRLGEAPLVVVSNREPLSHVWTDGRIQASRPASGLVTAMEPVMRACGGVWVAQGSGDADRETADERGRLRVPPDDPRYTLRRVWLSKEEEDGYYYGFANEGLWPLCHIVHTRPQFRPDDWAQYQAVNEKFAEAILEEIAGANSPIVLIQDYHFALLPTLVKRRRPDARTAIFWHIPWPNFEAFSICPWQDDLMQGMLGADIIGFHTQYYCNNFLNATERALEARIEWQHFSVTRGQHTTYVKPFPISVAPDFVEERPDTPRQAWLDGLGITAEFVGVGVERLDYTKGLPERVRALGRFFERFPDYRERLVFVELAAPSRSTIPRYQELKTEVEAAIREVNGSLQTRRWRPIIYLRRHHEHREIWPFYRHADFCMVTSLHDGMNLVAKEFVSVREDGDGVLILSQFTGASSELREALLVNPYDLDGVAGAIQAAVRMPVEERRARMARMRATVLEHNIYRWAGLLLSELAQIPEEAGVEPVR